MLSVKFIGHRGYGPTPSVKEDTPYPENSLMAFGRAIEVGADGFELDIFLSRDEKAAIIHDNRLHEHVVPSQAEQLRGRGVADFTMGELQQFDIGSGEKIPSLEEVFEFLAKHKDKNLILNMDVKDPKSVPIIMDSIKKYRKDNSRHDIIISSYKWDILRNFRKLDADVKLVPAIKTAILFGEENVGKNYMPLTDKYREGFREPIVALHNEINCYAFDCSITDYTPELIEFARDMGVGLQLSTGNDRVDAESTNYEVLRQLQESLDLGVPFVICKVDEPGKIREKFNQKLLNSLKP